jgi:hypothetical protein
VAVVGNLPPRQVVRLTQHREEEGDGFVERLLFAWPEYAGPVPADPEAAVSPEAARAWEAAAAWLFALPPGEEPTCYVLDAEARAHFWALYNRHQEEMAGPAVPIHLRPVWSKLRGYAARLVLILHLLRGAAAGAETAAVETDAVAAGWRLVDYLKSHLRKVHGALCGGRERERLVRLAEWLRRLPRPTFKPFEALHTLSCFRHGREVYAALAVLQQMGYVRERRPPATGQAGRPPGAVYAVNPRWQGETCPFLVDRTPGRTDDK